MTANPPLIAPRYVSREDTILYKATSLARQALETHPREALEKEIKRLESLKIDSKSTRYVNWKNALTVNRMQLEVNTLAQSTLELAEATYDYSRLAALFWEEMTGFRGRLAIMEGFFTAIADPETLKKTHNFLNQSPETEPKPHDKS